MCGLLLQLKYECCNIILPFEGVVGEVIHGDARGFTFTSTKKIMHDSCMNNTHMTWDDSIKLSGHTVSIAKLHSWLVCGLLHYREVLMALTDGTNSHRYQNIARVQNVTRLMLTILWKANPEVLLWTNPSLQYSNLQHVIITIILATIGQRFPVSVILSNHSHNQPIG